eukprot:GHVU01106702.1.p1 GENE.GHVU01106702.1~~GHVU01106702.1.p1  ORF type:complete len:851 (+),score=92.31 GHVU01106702.1:177-2729(+)
MNAEQVWKNFEKVGKGAGKQYYDVECIHCAAEALVTGSDIVSLPNCRLEKARNHILDCKAFARFKLRSESQHAVVALDHPRVEGGEAAASSAPQLDAAPAAAASAGPPSRIQSVPAGVTAGHRVSAPASGTNTTGRKRARGPLDEFIDHELTREQRAELHVRCLEMVATLRLPLSIFESECFARILDILRPAAKKDVPTRKVLGGPLLAQVAKKAEEEAVPVIRQRQMTGRCVGVLIDGFKNISDQHLWGIIIKCGDAWFSMDDGSGNLDVGDEHHGIATAQSLEKSLADAETVVEVPVRALCADQAGENGRAQRILALRFPHICQLPCYCRFFHNFAKEVLALPHFCVVFRDAAAVVTTIRMSSKKWKVRLDRENRRLYGKCPALVPLFKMRWNTAQAMAAVMLQIQTSLSMFARPHRGDPKFPRVFDRLDDKEFWDVLKEGEAGIRGLSFASMILQRDDNCPADVVLMFGHIFTSAVTAGNQAFLSVVHSRWRKVEQPLFLLAWALDPRFLPAFNHARGLVPGSFPPLFLADIAIYYYRKFFENDASGVALAVTEWLTQSWEEIRTYGSTGIWDLLRHSNEAGKQRLAYLALHLQTLPIQTAGSERLFSDYGAQKSKVRNRLHPHKVHKLTAVRLRVLRRERREATSRGRHYRILSAEELRVTVGGAQTRAAAMPRRRSESEWSDDHDAVQMLEFYDANLVPGRGGRGGAEIDVDMESGLAPVSGSHAAPGHQGPHHTSDDSGAESDDDAGEGAVAAAADDAAAWGQRTFGVPEIDEYTNANAAEGVESVSWDVSAHVARFKFSDGSVAGREPASRPVEPTPSCCSWRAGRGRVPKWRRGAGIPCVVS